MGTWVETGIQIPVSGLFVRNRVASAARDLCMHWVQSVRTSCVVLTLGVVEIETSEKCPQISSRRPPVGSDGIWGSRARKRSPFELERQCQGNGRGRRVAAGDHWSTRKVRGPSSEGRFSSLILRPTTYNARYTHVHVQGTYYPHTIRPSPFILHTTFCE